MLQLPPALAALGAREQFVTWFAVPSAKNPGKMDKLPCAWNTGAVIDAQDPQYWTTAEVALLMAPAYDRGHGAGAGFVFTAADDFWFLDGDGMLLPDGQWSPLAHELTARLTGAACEISQSGRGLHWFGRGAVPEHACKNTPLGLELYTSGRFCALTGHGAQGDAGADLTAAISLIAGQYFPPSVTGDFAGWTSEPVEEWRGPKDDDDLIRKAIASGRKSAALAFGGDPGKPTFEDLWTGNVEALGRMWPGSDGKPYDASHADMALANHLAFWTGKDCERMERLMRQSALARPKWDIHRTYLCEKTIMRACAFVGEVAKGGADPLPGPPPPPPEVLQAAAHVAGRTLRDATKEYMGPVEQLTHFDGCFYIARLKQVFSLPNNDLFDRTSFDVFYGGHLFVLDPMGAKTTDSAWEAFTKSRVNVPAAVNDLCFRPEIKPGAIVQEGARRWVNSFVPYNCATAPGDPAPFLDLLTKMLPNEQDRAILVNYMAALVQNPGAKFRWWPVIQGAEGNGKSFLINVLSYAVGEQYTHLPNVQALARDGMKFNSWIERKLFIGLEEIRVENRREFLEELKVVVTGKRIPTEGKGSNQTNSDNRANGMATTNYRDGVPVTADTRRYAIFYCAQQTAQDLERDGMGDAYFQKFAAWLERSGGYGVVAHYLKTFPVAADLNPVNMARAPRTSSSAEAVIRSLGRIEQEVLEAIEEERHGFAGGWVSSKHLDLLIEASRAGSVPRNKRREMMQSLGYDWHPALPDGRVNEPVEGGKPKLYVRAGHLALNLTNPSEVARLYLKAQEPRGASPAATAFSR